MWVPIPGQAYLGVPIAETGLTMLARHQMIALDFQILSCRALQLDALTLAKLYMDCRDFFMGASVLPEHILTEAESTLEEAYRVVDMISDRRAAGHPPIALGPTGSTERRAFTDAIEDMKITTRYVPGSN
jgi:hypothetical protein